MINEDDMRCDQMDYIAPNQTPQCTTIIPRDDQDSFCLDARDYTSHLVEPKKEKKGPVFFSRSRTMDYDSGIPPHLVV